MTKLQRFSLLVLLPALLASCGGGMGTSSTSGNAQSQAPTSQTPATPTPVITPSTPVTQTPDTTPATQNPVTIPVTQTPVTAPVTTPVMTPSVPVTPTPVATPVNTPDTPTTPTTPTTPSTPAADTYSVSPSPATQKLLEMTNAARAAGAQCSGATSGGAFPTAYYPPAAPLVWNGHLGGSAVKFSAELAQVNAPALSHIGTNGSTLATRDEAAGYTQWKILGENLAQGFSDSDSDVAAVVNAWLTSSEGHCQNMMNKDYKEFGAGYTNGYWVEEFGAAF